ncbi:MAG: aldose epimerase family protein [Deinococcales bacterium]
MIRTIYEAQQPQGPLYVFSLKNRHGLEAQISNYGGIILKLLTPDRQGQLADIVLGYDTIEAYQYNPAYFGCIVGRYANRIAKAQFSLAGKSYQLAKNDGEHHLHGGLKGFDKRLWQVESADTSLLLSYLSPDGEENYPGQLEIKVRYQLDDDNRLIIDYEATSNRDTLINLTNHSYFNLKGQGQGDILDHQLKLYADSFTPIDEGLIPTGELRQVEASPFDFRQFKVIGQEIDQVDEQLRFGQGYDHNWVIRQEQPIKHQNKTLYQAASIFEKTSGRQLNSYSTCPGVQFYSGNMMTTMQGKAGKSYHRRYGFCLETQYFPDSPNQPHFPSSLLKAGELYQESTIYQFSTQS